MLVYGVFRWVLLRKVLSLEELASGPSLARASLELGA
jgi:hypothetical protein